MLNIRYEVALAAASENLVAIDSPCLVLKNIDELVKEIMIAKGLGYSGKVALHPCQVKAINDGFSPSEKEINKAMEIVELIEGKDPIALTEGSIIGPPFLKIAKDILRKHENIINLSAIK